MERNLAGKLPEALPVFRACLESVGFEIVPLPAQKALAPWMGLTVEKDLPVLASAILGGADVLVTGDKSDLLKIETESLPLRIMSPAEFLDRFLPDFLKTKEI